MPAALSRLIWARRISRITAALSGSRLPVGSSASTSAGRCASARATATRCISPPDSSRGRLPARCARPTAVSSSSTRCAAAGPASPLSASGRPTLRATLRCGSRWKAWNTKPMRARRTRVRAVSSRLREVAALEQDLARVGHVEPGDEVEQRGLADAGLAHDRDVLARLHRELEAVEHAPAARAAVGLRQVANVEHAGQIAADGRDSWIHRRRRGPR